MNTMHRARILLADDHTILTEGLVSLLKSEFDVVGTVADGHALLEAAKRLRPDVIITDISMPGMTGLDALERVKKQGVNSRFIILTMYGEAEVAAKAMRSGASGFLLKHSAGEELVDAIHEVMQGRFYLTPAVTKT